MTSTNDQGPTESSAFWRLMETPIRNPIPRLAPCGIILRELKAARSAIVSLIVFFLLFPLLDRLGDLLSQLYSWNPFNFGPHAIARLWWVLTIIIAFLLGILCGAEEAENGTLDFVFRLPIGRMRIFSEKLCGALLSFLYWVLQSIGFYIILNLIISRDNAWMLWDSGTLRQNPFFMNHLHEDRQMLHLAIIWAPLLFSFGLAAGAWTGRVIVAAVVAGLAAVAYNFLAFRFVSPLESFFDSHFASPEQELGGPALTIVAAGCLFALAIAATRYATREAR